MQSAFQVGSANAAPAAPVVRNDFHASQERGGDLCASTAPGPPGLSVLRSTHPTEPTAARVSALPAPANASAHPQQPENRQGGACVPEAAAPSTAPLQPSNRSHQNAASTAYRCVYLPTVHMPITCHVHMSADRKSAVTLSIPIASTVSRLCSAQIGHGNAILVNRNQQGNPVLKHVRNVNYRFADVVPDFQFNDQVCINHEHSAAWATIDSTRLQLYPVCVN